MEYIQNQFNHTYKRLSFKGALININALSDTHGELNKCNNALEELKDHQDIFCSEGKGRQNIMAVCGDWFMDGSKKGYLTNPDKPNAQFQLEILNEFFNQIKGFAKNTTMLFTPGNHEFDGGVQLFNQIISNLNAKVIMTNLDKENSPAFEENIKSNKIINEQIINIEDDKNPKLTHKILFLGVSPVNLNAYQPNTQGIKLLDNVNKSQKNINQNDYQKTFSDCIERINKFKKENPKGIVILMSHTGVNFADNLCKNAPVDLVFDGHEHKEEIRTINGINIIPMSQNFKKLVNTQIKINDDGTLENIKIKTLVPSESKTQGPIKELYDKLFQKDLEKKYSIISENMETNELNIEGIRTGNNYLANFVTDCVLEEIKKLDSDVDFFALNSAAIRNPLKVSKEAGVSSIDIINTLKGIKEDDAKIMTTKINGLELTYMILDNFLYNRDYPQRNPLIHYSGLTADRSGMLTAYENGDSLEDLTKYIIDEKSNQPIDSNKQYKIANTEKYFNKSQNPKIKAFKQKSEFLGVIVQDLFKEHFLNSNGTLKAKCDIRIK